MNDKKSENDTQNPEATVANEVGLNLDNIEEFEEIDISEEAMELSELNELRVENEELKDRVMRALAEAENQRKRGERNRRDAEIYGGSKLAKDMLSVYDNMSRALSVIDDAQRESSRALIEGIELTQRELLNVFRTHNIVKYGKLARTM